MSRQVIIGAIVGFLATVTLMAVCQQKPSSINSDAPQPVQRVDLEPARFDQPMRGGVQPAPVPYREPLKSLPAAARPMNLEGFDAGGR